MDNTKYVYTILANLQIKLLSSSKTYRQESGEVETIINECSLMSMTLILLSSVIGGTRDENNGSRSDDLIYWPFFVQSLLITSHTALSLIYMYLQSTKGMKLEGSKF
jgi:hypothetical protein